jgi:hypothetical protein
MNGMVSMLPMTKAADANLAFGCWVLCHFSVMKSVVSLAVSVKTWRLYIQLKKDGVVLSL